MNLNKQLIISFIFILFISIILIWGMSHLKEQKEMNETREMLEKDLIDMRIAVIENNNDALEIQINQVKKEIDSIEPTENIDYDRIISDVAKEIDTYQPTADCLTIEYESKNTTTFYCKNR